MYYIIPMGSKSNPFDKNNIKLFSFCDRYYDKINVIKDNDNFVIRENNV
jgi:hypothetical protein|tara:strand:+ start:48 stop:194 length:147 start_codon:yes stop_codon:yes gene_type:complete